MSKGVGDGERRVSLVVEQYRVGAEVWARLPAYQELRNDVDEAGGDRDSGDSGDSGDDEGDSHYLYGDGDSGRDLGGYGYGYGDGDGYGGYGGTHGGDEVEEEWDREDADAEAEAEAEAEEGLGWGWGRWRARWSRWQRQWHVMAARYMEQELDWMGVGLVVMFVGSFGLYLI